MQSPGLEPGVDASPFGRPDPAAFTNPAAAQPFVASAHDEDVVEPDEDDPDEEDSPELVEDADSGDDAPFAVLPPALRSALEGRGFESFTSVQQAVFDAVGDGCDLRISSQTGSGKTVALGLAMAEDVLVDANAVARPTREYRGPVALVIVPTRELAAQVAEELSWLFAEVQGASVDVVTGGTSVPIERRRLARSPRILVGTPGRLVDHLEAGALKLDSVRQLVLDEADQMLDMGFRDELEAILDRTPPERHTHLVSATFPSAIQRLADRYQRDSRSVEGSRLGEANADIEHIGHLVRPDQRYDLLVNYLLLAGGERTLVFVNTRAETGELSARLAEDGFGAQPLSGELQQAQRTRTLAAFRAGSAPVLVATDVAARGLDVPDVALVIHTAVPIDAEVYTHRSGRTGRAGQSGKSVLMVAPSRERRAARMLGDAGMELRWKPVPQGHDVQTMLDARAQATLTARLEAAATPDGAPTAAQRELARALLADRDPELVVAALLPKASATPPTAPREIQDAPQPRAFDQGRKAGRKGAFERSAPADRFGRTQAPRRTFGERSGPEPFEGPSHSRDAFLRGDDRRGSAPFERGGQRNEGRPSERFEERPPRPRASDFVRFRVNWGFRGGANPRRLLATLCRRGGVSSREIGSIDIAPASSTFEVAGYAAEAFAQRAGQDDPRDPGLWVSLDEQQSQDRRPRARGPRR